MSSAAESPFISSVSSIQHSLKASGTPSSFSELWMDFTNAIKVSRSLLAVSLLGTSSASTGVACSSDISLVDAEAGVDVPSPLPPQPASKVHKIQIGITNFAGRE